MFRVELEPDQKSSLLIFEMPGLSGSVVVVSKFIFRICSMGTGGLIPFGTMYELLSGGLFAV